MNVEKRLWMLQDEQGAQHRSSSGHPGQRTTNRRRRSESLTEISLDSESDDEAVNRLLPPPLHSVPESEPLWNPQAAIRYPINHHLNPTCKIQKALHESENSLMALEHLLIPFL